MAVSFPLMDVIVWNRFGTLSVLCSITPSSLISGMDCMVDIVVVSAVLPVVSSAVLPVVSSAVLPVVV